MKNFECPFCKEQENEHNSIIRKILAKIIGTNFSVSPFANISTINPIIKSKHITDKAAKDIVNILEKNKSLYLNKYFQSFFIITSHTNIP